jgi:hypothetical protein
VVDLALQSIDWDWMIELFMTIDHSAFVVLTRRGDGKAGQANGHESGEDSRFFHA